MGLFDFGSINTSDSGKSAGDIAKEAAVAAAMTIAGFTSAYNGIVEHANPAVQAEQAGHSIAMNAETTQTAAINEATVSLGDTSTSQSK